MEAVSLKRVYDYELARSDLVSPEQSLRVSLARSGKRNFAKSIYFNWPNVETGIEETRRGDHAPISEPERQRSSSRRRVGRRLRHFTKRPWKPTASRGGWPSTSRRCSM